MRSKFGVRIAVCFGLLFCLARPGAALYTDLHVLIAHEASGVSGAPAEVSLYLGDPTDCIHSGRDALCRGIYDEDAEIDPRMDPSNPLAWIGAFNSGTHLWDPGGGPSGGRLDSVNGMGVNRSKQNAYQRALTLYNEAVTAYIHDPETAYYIFGRAVHLLADMATPAHVHLDPHVSDRDSTGDDSFEEVTGRRYITADREVGVELFRTDFPVGGLRGAEPSSLPDGGYSGEPPLFRLFYDMATASTAFDSDDADGFIDRGTRRGVGIPFESATVSGISIGSSAGETLLDPLGYGFSPLRSKLILLDEAVELMQAAQPPFTRLHIETPGGVEFRDLEEFSRSDMRDSDVLEISRSLFPRALADTAGLYRLFWNDTHHLIAAGAPEIGLNKGRHITRISRPDPIELVIDILPGSRDGEETEFYVWFDARQGGNRTRAYLNGDWSVFEASPEMRPLFGTVKLAAVTGLSWVFLASTEGLPDLDLTLNICMDLHPDGLFTPDRSVCGAALIIIRP